MPYVKLDTGILDSTLWLSDSDVRIVFITMLAMATPDGLVEATAPGIARRANLSIEAVRQAVKVLEGPDEDSRSLADEGRRVNRVDGGYQIVNYIKYREKDHTNAERQRRYREKRRDPVITAVIERDGERCGICGESVSPSRAHLDHIVPLFQDGPASEGSAMNYQLAHPACNNGKSGGATNRPWRHLSMPPVTVLGVTYGSGVTDKTPVTPLVTHADAEADANKREGFSLPDWIPKDLWSEWMEVRRKKKAVNSPKAKNALINNLEQIQRAGISPEVAITKAIEKSWKSVELDWLKNCGLGDQRKTNEPRSRAGREL